MDLSLLRFATGKESTLGAMYLSGAEKKFRCFTLEDQFNEPKIPGETRIPVGRYEVKMRTGESPMNKKYADRYPWFKGHLWLQDVPGFTFIYIHVGNSDDDTAGCILVGDGAQSNVIEDGRLIGSVAAYKRLYEEVITAMDGGEKIFISVEDYA